MHLERQRELNQLRCSQTVVRGQVYHRGRDSYDGKEKHVLDCRRKSRRRSWDCVRFQVIVRDSYWYVYSNLLPCELVDIYRRLWRTCCLAWGSQSWIYHFILSSPFDPKDGGSMFLRNVRYTVSNNRKYLNTNWYYTDITLTVLFVLNLISRKFGFIPMDAKLSGADTSCLLE
jgi:hypothetical protein